MNDPSQSVTLSASARGHGGPTDPSNDDLLRRGIIETQVTPWMSRVLVGGFLLGIFAVPVGQVVQEVLDDEEPSIYELFERVPTKANLSQFEEVLEDLSYPKAYVQPRMQLLLSQLGRVGNKKTVIGSEGWLFYTPGVTYVAGPSFLEPAVLTARQTAAQDALEEQLFADPRPAILAFNAALAARGIHLLVFPTPDKAMLEPWHLHGRASKKDAVDVANNVAFARFVDDLRKHGIDVFDPTPQRITESEGDRFLVQDTHWAPGYLSEVAKQLASTVTPWLGKDGERVRYTRSQQEVERIGDLVDMLELPEEQRLFEPQRVTIDVVKGEDGEDFEANPSSSVLLMGDSFTNIYSQVYMGWGQSAGLAEQLAYHLQRPIDVIAQNDSGAFATRELLANALASADRLAGKKVVVWEFASRELAVGNWKPVAWPASPGSEP